MRMMTMAMVALALGTELLGQQPVRTIEDGVLDRIELHVATLDRAAYSAVVIKPFATDIANLGTGGKDGKEVRQQEAQTMQHEGPRVLAERFVVTLQKEGVFKDVKASIVTDSVPAGALVIDGKFIEIDPGSRAKRYFVGFGAGKSSVKVSGTLSDASGRTLATFEQRRIGAMGAGGGDSLGKLMADSRNIGEDIAKFVSRWARGEKLD